jgi:hypothetical protein
MLLLDDHAGEVLENVEGVPLLEAIDGSAYITRMSLFCLVKVDCSLYFCHLFRALLQFNFVHYLMSPF